MGARSPFYLSFFISVYKSYPQHMQNFNKEEHFPGSFSWCVFIPLCLRLLLFLQDREASFRLWWEFSLRFFTMYKSIHNQYVPAKANGCVVRNRTIHSTKRVVVSSQRLIYRSMPKIFSIILTDLVFHSYRNNSKIIINILRDYQLILVYFYVTAKLVVVKCLSDINIGQSSKR